MKLHQSVLIPFYDLERRGKQHKVGKKFSYIFDKPIYIVIVAKSRGFAVRLAEFWAVSQACGKIS